MKKRYLVKFAGMAAAFGLVMALGQLSGLLLKNACTVMT